jgi:hypothetical protein
MRRGSGGIDLHCAGSVITLANRRAGCYSATLIIGDAFLWRSTTASQQLPGSTGLFPTMPRVLCQPAGALAPLDELAGLLH